MARKGVLPKDAYASLTRTDKSIPKQLLKSFADIPQDASGDVFGQIYEYFLGSFAMAEGQGGGEFFTPRSVVRLMVEIIEPHHGKVFDPACGSGGMFVQSAHFIEQHRRMSPSLCKLATPVEVKEQDCSLNPGRYVGVVIEEDGKTEEEFVADLHTPIEQDGEPIQCCFPVVNPPQGPIRHGFDHRMYRG